MFVSESWTRQADTGSMVAYVWSDHSFGAATIRSDRQPPALRSVASNVNYGDEGGAASLVCSVRVFVPPLPPFDRVSTRLLLYPRR